MILWGLLDSRLICRPMVSTEFLRSLLMSINPPDTRTLAQIPTAITAWARTPDNYRPHSTRYMASTKSSSDLMAASTRSTTYKPTPRLDSSALITLAPVPARALGLGIQQTVSPTAAAIPWQAS